MVRRLLQSTASAYLGTTAKEEAEVLPLAVAFCGLSSPDPLCVRSMRVQSLRPQAAVSSCTGPFGTAASWQPGLQP